MRCQRGHAHQGWWHHIWSCPLLIPLLPALLSNCLNSLQSGLSQVLSLESSSFFFYLRDLTWSCFFNNCFQDYFTQLFLDKQFIECSLDNKLIVSRASFNVTHERFFILFYLFFISKNFIDYFTHTHIHTCNILLSYSPLIKLSYPLLPHAVLLITVRSPLVLYLLNFGPLSLIRVACRNMGRGSLLGTSSHIIKDNDSHSGKH